MTAVVDDQQCAIGVFTDGDLRRALDSNIDIHATRVEAAMTTGFKKMSRNDLAADAVALMQSSKITSVLVVDEHEQLEGVLHMHDLLNAGVL